MEQMTLEDIKAVDVPMYELLIKAYGFGIDHGLLLAEQERDSEDWGYAAANVGFSRNICRPLGADTRRQPRSQAWRDAMAESTIDFLKLCKEVYDGLN